MTTIRVFSGTFNTHRHENIGNYGSGFALNSRNGAPVDYELDNTTPATINGQVAIPQRWGFTTQTIRWWPAQLFPAFAANVSVDTASGFNPYYSRFIGRIGGGGGGSV